MRKINFNLEIIIYVGLLKTIGYLLGMTSGSKIRNRFQPSYYPGNITSRHDVWKHVRGHRSGSYLARTGRSRGAREPTRLNAPSVMRSGWQRRRVANLAT